MHTPIKFLALGLTLFTSVCSAASLTGKTIPPYPRGWGEPEGACLDNCRYSIGVLSNGQTKILYLGKEVAGFTPDEPRWLVLDEMPYPQAPKGFRVTYGTCQVNKVDDSSIIAVVKETETEWQTQVKFAYRANIKTGQLETITTKGVRCANEGWGL
jgi:hypothetical protein